MTPVARATVATLALAFLTTACASSGGLDWDARDEQATRIQVENFNSQRITVNAVSGGADFRLGDVGTTQTASFALPRTVSGFELQILVDPIGSSRTYMSRRIQFNPGDVIRVVVEANLDLTSVTIR